MRRSCALALTMAAWMLLASRPAIAQQEAPTTIAGSVGYTLNWVEGNFLGVAEAMPEDRYSFVPSNGNFAGVRSFAEQVKHVACANFAFFNSFSPSSSIP